VIKPGALSVCRYFTISLPVGSPSAAADVVAAGPVELSAALADKPGFSPNTMNSNALEMNAPMECGTDLQIQLIHAFTNATITTMTAATITALTAVMITALTTGVDATTQTAIQLRLVLQSTAISLSAAGNWGLEWFFA